MDKIELFYNIVDSGDGSGHLEWYEDEELRDAAVENTDDDEWSCSLGEGSVETFRGSDIHHQAMDNNK